MKRLDPFLRALGIAGILFVAFMTFRVPVFHWLESYVFPLLEMSRSGWSDALIVIAAVFCIYISGWKSSKVISPGWMALILIGWIVFFAFEAFNSEWCSLHILYCKWLPYSGVILVALTVPWLVKYVWYLIGKCKSGKNPSDAGDQFAPFIKDDAIERDEDDMFGWRYDTKRLIGRLLLDKTGSSVSVAVTAPWGAGKSSYLNLLKNVIKTDNRFLLIEFNPRKSASHVTIRQDFLNLLRDVLSDYDSSAVGYVSKYIEALELVDDKSLIPKLISLTGINDPESYKSSIGEILSETGKTLVVVIDDLDRLTGPEILEVLKLIDFNVNFPGSIFISAFDKDYVEQAIASLVSNRRNVSSDKERNSNFTDKYFTLEHPLPNVKPNRLMEYLFSLLKKNGEDEESIDFNQNLIGFLSANMLMIYDYLPTVRDVKRFCNVFIPGYYKKCLNRKFQEVDFKDYFLLSLLRYRYPATYESIRSRRIVYLNELDNSSQMFRNEEAENVEGNEIVMMLFNKYDRRSSFSLDRKYFKSIRHVKAFNGYFYDYDGDYNVIQDYIRIIDPEVSIDDAGQILNSRLKNGSDGFSIIDLIYHDVAEWNFTDREHYKRNLDLRVLLADSRDDITAVNMLVQIKVMPDSGFLRQIGFGNASSSEDDYKTWLKEWIENLRVSWGSQRLLQNIRYTINSPQKEVFNTAEVKELTRHHLRKAVKKIGETGFDPTIALSLMVSAGQAEDIDKFTPDEESIKILSEALLKNPKPFIPVILYSMTSSDSKFLNIILSPNGIAEVLSYNETFKKLVEILRGGDDPLESGIVHFYDECFVKGQQEWILKIPESINPKDYLSRIDLLKAVLRII